MGMIEVRKLQLEKERAYLVGVGVKGESEKQITEQLEELALLADTAGADIIGSTYQMRFSPDKTFHLGRGRAQDLLEEVKRLEINLVIFNDDLSPSQQRNLENLLKVKTIDRSMLILDIFSRHAQTYESRVQVELAQMIYLAPRLTGMWTHFGQQAGGRAVAGPGGGIGSRGPGETQLETDKRLVKKRISDLKKKLKVIERQREQQKKRRGRTFTTCLVGYTNVGKSTLLNALSNATVLTENKLFATLDATTRKVFLPKFGEVLMSDTVGFIRKLPHHLVASFKSTLEVITDADLIINVLDASNDNQKEHMEVVNRVLNDLKTQNIPRLTVFNKIDCISEPGYLEQLKDTYPEACFVSARRGKGTNELKTVLYEQAVKCGYSPAPHLVEVVSE
jgi:GTP-binding protein HflX